MSMGIVNKDTAATIPAAGNTGDKVGNLAALHTTVKSDIVAAVNEVKDEQANKADMDIVADAFNAAETYAEGDYCTYEGGLYKFKTAHEGAWDAADVDQIQIAGELSELKNTITKQTYSITNQSQYISLLRYIQGNIDFTKITDTSYIKVSYSGSDRTDIYKLTRNGEKVVFSFISGGSNVLRVWEASIFNNSNNPTLYLYEFLGSGNSITDMTNTDCTGQTWTLYY